MSKVTTVIFGSPRSNGNSDKLANALISGAIENGKTVRSVIIRDLIIKGCIGCEYCYSNYGICAQEDDMQQVYEILENTNTIVFATPIYYQGFPSQLKAIIDRLYVMENRYFPIQNAVLLATYASPGEEMSLSTIEYYKILVKYHHWNNKGIIAVAGLDEKDDILGNDALLTAKQLGEKL